MLGSPIEGGRQSMSHKNICNIENTIAFIEEHLNEKLDLETVAEAMHYSKYHLHRMFGEITGITLHDYVIRRQLTEAAKLLVFSERPVLDIAICCGYESQQAFAAAFKAMYKLPPAKFREKGEFYPLQLRYSLSEDMEGKRLTAEGIRPAGEKDIPAWMELVRLAIDGYPHLNEEEYLRKLREHIEKGQALILKENELAAGVLAFSYETGSIEFFGVHPQYRKGNIARLFLDKLMEEFLPGQDISITTYREGDRADTGYRKGLKGLGFAERELLTEFGYPTQRFVLSVPDMEGGCDGN